MPWWKWISPLPLDELSFLYFLRTIPLDREGAHQFNRHFGVTRNPTLVTVGAEEVVETIAGAFTTSVMIMHVRDPKHHKGIGLFKLNIELSSCRIPVRFVSHMMKEFSNGAAADGGNGQALYNPLVGNLILDAFTTEVGAEAIFQKHGLLGVVALTNGEVRGQTLRASDRSPAFMAKLGFDKQLNDDLRTRLTGSFRNQGSAANGTLYSGDRADSRYYYVLENTASTEAANFTSGMINPAFTDKVNAVMVNPFIKFRGGNRHA